MSRRKHFRKHKLRYFAALLAVCAAGFFYWSKVRQQCLPPLAARPSAVKPSAGYKMEDRLKLEQLINQGAKDD